VQQNWVFLAQHLPPHIDLQLQIPYVSLKGEEYHVPAHLYNVPKLLVHRCRDEGPATKVLAALRHENVRDDCILIIVDDDRPYKPDIFAALSAAVSLEDGAVHTMWEPKILGCCGFAFRKRLLLDLATYEVPEECRWIDDDYFEFYITQYRRLPLRVVTLPLERPHGSIWDMSDREDTSPEYRSMQLSGEQLSVMDREPLQHSCKRVLQKLMQR
jgi:hypothetical protein